MNNASNLVPAELSHSPTMSNEQLIAEWRLWASEAGTEVEQRSRARAVTRLRACLIGGETGLDLSGLGLTSLPEHLPPLVTRLNVSDNQLTTMPNLPSSLTGLDARNNRLTTLPPDLSSSLTYLYVRNNRLRTLPDLPSSLTYLHVGDNPLTTLPETLLQLSSMSQIYLGSHPLQVLQDIQRSVNQADYRGPRIHFSILQPEIEETSSSLHDTVSRWFPSEQAEAITNTWTPFETEANAAIFSEFLGRLSGTPSARVPEFRVRVATWLTELAANPTLRSGTFDIAMESTETCDDRIALTYNTMQEKAMVVGISRGEYDNNLSELMSKARDIFRMEQLGKIARTKAASLRFVDEIEVYLAYQVGLRDVLQLSFVTDEMIFRSMSNVSDDDLNAAAAQVKQAEGSGFTEWLSQWEPWQEALARIAPDETQAAADARHAALETTYPERLTAALRDVGLENDADAERTLGTRIMNELNAEIDIRTTRQVLEQHDSLSLLDNPWPHDPNQQYGSDGAGSSSTHNLLTHELLQKVGAWRLSDIVSEFTSQGAELHFAPQGILLGDDAQGICDSLSEAWLQMLSADNTGALKNILLDNVFLRSQRLGGDAETQGSTEGFSSADTQAFLNVLDRLHSTGTRTIQTLDGIVHSLTTATGELSLSLHTGNHALALARRTLNGETSYLFYDPNLGEVSLPVSGTPSEQAASLKSLLTDILSMKTGSGEETLADFYQTVTRSSEYTFTVQTVDPEAQAARPEYQALKDQLLADQTLVPAELSHSPAINIPEVLLKLSEETTPSLNRLQASAQVQETFNVGSHVAQSFINKIQEIISETQGHDFKISVISPDTSTSSSTSNSLAAELVGTTEDGHEVRRVIPVDLEALGKEQQPGMEAQFVEHGGAFALGKALSAYAFITSAMGLIGSINRGDTQGEIVNGSFFVMSTADLTGFAESLANRITSAFGITGTEVFGGGINGLLGKGVSELASLAGVGESAAGALGTVAAGLPLVNSAVIAYTLYSDVGAFQHATTPDETRRAIGVLSSDVISGTAMLGASAASIVGTLMGSAVVSSVAGGVGGAAAIIGILIDASLRSEDPLGLRESYGNGEYNTIVGTLDELDKSKTDDPQKLYQITPTASDNTLGMLSFNVIDDDKHLSAYSSSTGDMNIALNEDGRGFDFSWTNSAGHLPLSLLDADAAQAEGPERFHREVNTETVVNDVIMGMGTVYSLSYDYENYGHMEMGTWSEGDDPTWRSVHPQEQNMDELVSNVHVEPVTRQFTVTGNNAENRFISGYTNENTPYSYTVNGEGGDDTLLAGDHGQYIFDGGDNAEHGGDWVIASQQKHDANGEYTVYDLQSGVDINSLTQGYTLRKNFSLELKNVENIVGSTNNELFRGNDKRNMIVTGGGNDVVWLSGGGDLYTVEHGSQAYSVHFKGDVNRASNGDRDVVNLQLATWDGVNIDGNTLLVSSTDRIELDEAAREQLVFSVADGSLLFYSGGATPGWALSLAQSSFNGDTLPAEVLSQLHDMPFIGGMSLPIVVTPDSQSFNLPTGDYAVPKGVNHLLLNMHDEKIGANWRVDYIGNDEVKTFASAEITLIDSFGSLPPTLYKQLNDIVGQDALAHTELVSHDGVSFHFAMQSSVDGNTTPSLVVDSIDVATFQAARTVLGHGESMQGVGLLVVDVTKLLQSAPQMLTLEPGQLVPQSVVLYRTAEPLTTESVAVLLDSQSSMDSGWRFPDGHSLNVLGSIDGMTLQIDDGQHVLTETFAQGLVSQVIFHESTAFNQLNMPSLYALAELVSGEHLSSKDRRLTVSTSDGVSFHFENQSGVDGKQRCVVVVDAVDANAYSAYHGGAVVTWGHGEPLEGVDDIVADITGLVQNRVYDQRKLIIGSSWAAQSVMIYRSTSELTATMLESGLSGQRDRFGWSLALPDGHHLYLENMDTLSGRELIIEDSAGSQWSIVFARNSDIGGEPYIEQAVDMTGHSHIMVSAGHMMAVYNGDSSHQLGVSIDLSQAVQHGVDAEGAQLVGVHDISGSRFADTLSGDSTNNVLAGNAGDDLLAGGGGADLLIGGAGADTYLVKKGEQVVISAQDNGNAIDTLKLDGVGLEDVRVVLNKDDLIVQGDDSIVVLKNWTKGDTHYNLVLSDGQLNAVQFGDFVKGELSIPQLIQNLSSQYEKLAQENALIDAQQPEHGTFVSTATQASTRGSNNVQTLNAAEWHIGSETDGDVQRNRDGGVQLHGAVVMSEATGQQLDASADYRISMDLESTAEGLAGVHAHLVVDGHRLQEIGGPVTHDGVVSSDIGFRMRHSDVMMDGGSLAKVLSNGDHELSVEIEKTGGASIIVHAVQLQKLTGAMASFDSGNDGGVEMATTGMTEVLIPSLTASLV